MAYQIWWALVLGFLISAIVQSWVPRERIEGGLSGKGFGAVAKATGLGAASSSCSYAAISIARSLFAKGASAASALAFQFASTNLVWELGLVLWILLGPLFTLAEFVGGVVLIALMWAGSRLLIPAELEEEARDHAEAAGSADREDEQGGDEEPRASIAERLRSRAAWTTVAEAFLADWRMLWKEILAGFFLAGFIGLLGEDIFTAVFLTEAPGAVQLLENAIVGPLVAIASFVCSVGNVPLAAVLWANGISFGGVLAFLFADLIIVPIVLAYRKFYGGRYALRISAMMFVAAVIAAVLVDLLFGLAGLIPASRPSGEDVFGEFSLNYRFFLTLAGLAIFASMLWLARSARSD